MIRTEENHLAHYGILRKSGRYPWGSGGTQSKRNRTFLDIINEHKKQGLTPKQIADYHGITTKQLRAGITIAGAQQRQEKILRVNRLAEKGYSNTEIGRLMGMNESSVRSYRKVGALDKATALHTTASMLKDQVDKKKYIDIGTGVEFQIGVNRSRLDNAVAVLKEKGYTTHVIQVQQLGTGKYTNTKVLAPPGTTLKEVQKNRGQIQQITQQSLDNGRSFFGIQPPIQINSKRLHVNYKEDGGGKVDGLIYVRPDIPDLSIGSDRYAQVRIAVDGTHYLKGMAVYKENLPEGVDLIFNTSKPKESGWKTDNNKISNDPELPFGSLVWQMRGPDGKVSSAMNKVGGKEGAGTEGSWDTWSRNLPSQFLSKQSPDLARQQLSLNFERRVRDLNEINSLTNPMVRRNLLLRFADSADSASVHLHAASLPRQATKVLLPIPSLKPTEIYAPSMRDGETVALVRFPHAGPFEIPQLTVNNRNREARKIIGTLSPDAVGIHHDVAARLSGADFDGDTVLVIPNNNKLVKSKPPLEDLKNFDPMVYKLPKDSPIPRMDSERKGNEMGKISNLITDMSLQEASSSELARAVKHSMVVIDAEKHELDFRSSEKDHGILALKERYQGGKRHGAQTLISRAKALEFVPQRVERKPSQGGPIDPRTGEKVFVPTGRMKSKTKTVLDPKTGRNIQVPTGEMEPVMTRSTKLTEAKDAHSLIKPPGTAMEFIYAEHSNRLKAMANSARKDSLTISNIPTSNSAKKVYAPEVASITSKLNLALRNAPYERQAQLLANISVGQRRQANPGMDKDELKKIRTHALNEARIRTGAKRHQIKLTQREWDAIQAGAISSSKLKKVLNNSDIDSIRELALPKKQLKFTNTMKDRAQSMFERGYTQQEVADALGVGLTTLKVGLNG